jgi:hypothetical protein
VLGTYPTSFSHPFYLLRGLNLQSHRDSNYNQISDCQRYAILANLRTAIPLLFSADHYLVQFWGFPKNAWQYHESWETAYNKVNNRHIKHGDSVFGERYQFKPQGQQGMQTERGKTVPVRDLHQVPNQASQFCPVPHASLRLGTVSVDCNSEQFKKVWAILNLLPKPNLSLIPPRSN